MRSKPRFTPPILCALICAALLVAGGLPALAAPQSVADVEYAPDGLSITVNYPNEGVTLAVSGPIKYATNRYFERGERVEFSIFDNGEVLRDGLYRFEVRLFAELDPEIRAELKRARETGDYRVVEELCNEGLIPLEALTETGYFTIVEGRIVDPGLQEDPRRADTQAASPEDGLAVNSEGEGLSLISDNASGGTLENVNGKTVISGDAIVYNSICVGFDCPTNPSFGANTIILQENNLRIRFLDTSVGSFPSTDWQLTANSNLSGGANKFSIEDITAARIPFTIEANAPSNSLYVDNGGRIGVRTANPVTDIHIVDGDTPTLRLQQDSSSGFAPQTWDVAGNETSFFVRDATNGSTLPFRIFPGESSGALVVRDGNIGMGTTSPSAGLHVRGTDGNTDFLVEEASSTEAARVMAELRNNGRVLWTMTDSSGNGTTWRFRTVEGQFNFDSDLGAGNEFVLDSSGNLTILGTLTQNSNREAKTNIRNVDSHEVLNKVAQLPISSWAYKTQQDVEHIGPMAQDFYSLFGVGAGNTGIANYDTAGVALASIQALYSLIQEKDSKIEELKAEKADEIEALKRQNEELLKRLVALEESR